jgi:hypothetical protein
MMGNNFMSGRDSAKQAVQKKAAIFKKQIIKMSLRIFHVRIKKKYVEAIIKDLEKIEAVELLDPPPIPEWQKKEVRKRLKELKKQPAKAVSWE